MEERPIEHYEGKVLAAAEKQVDARYKKSGDRRTCDLVLANAVTDLRKRRAEIAAEALPKPP
jgi:hypothetical protein